MIQTLSRGSLQALMERQTGPCISLYMPTDRTGVNRQQDQLRIRRLKKPGLWSSRLSYRHGKKLLPTTGSGSVLSERPTRAARSCPPPTMGAWRACSWPWTSNCGEGLIPRPEGSRLTSKQNRVMRTCWTKLQPRRCCMGEQSMLSRKLRCQPRHHSQPCFATEL